jgi:hypothetical protein
MWRIYSNPDPHGKQELGQEIGHTEVKLSFKHFPRFDPLIFKNHDETPDSQK